MTTPSGSSDAIRPLADRLAARLTDDTSPAAEALQHLDAEYRELLSAVTRLSARYAFDRAGRPGAIGAVRDALPLMERDLFDAVVEDHACEVAAIEEALYQLVLAYGRRCRGER
jgi:hypothetical protein